MKTVFRFPADRKAEVERFVKGDETVNRGSIVFRDGSWMREEGTAYLIYDGSEEAVKKIEEIAERAENEKEIIGKLEEEEMKAAEGFGNILF